MLGRLFAWAGRWLCAHGGHDLEPLEGRGFHFMALPVRCRRCGVEGLQRLYDN